MSSIILQMFQSPLGFFLPNSRQHVIKKCDNNLITNYRPIPFLSVLKKFIKPSFWETEKICQIDNLDIPKVYPLKMPHSDFII